MQRAQDQLPDGPDEAGGRSSARLLKELYNRESGAYNLLHVLVMAGVYEEAEYSILAQSLVAEGSI